MVAETHFIKAFHDAGGSYEVFGDAGFKHRSGGANIPRGASVATSPTGDDTTKITAASSGSIAGESEPESPVDVTATASAGDDTASESVVDDTAPALPAPSIDVSKKPEECVAKLLPVSQ